MTFIYKIYDIETKECYIGSTKQTIKARMKDHRSGGNNTSSKKIIQNNNYDIIILEECDEKIRFIREQYYIDNTENTLNKKNCLYDPIHRKNYLIKYDKTKREWIKSFGYKFYNYNHNNLLRIDVDLFKV